MLVLASLWGLWLWRQLGFSAFVVLFGQLGVAGLPLAPAGFTWWVDGIPTRAPSVSLQRGCSSWEDKDTLLVGDLSGWHSYTCPSSPRVSGQGRGFQPSPICREVKTDKAMGREVSHKWKNSYGAGIQTNKCVCGCRVGWAVSTGDEVSQRPDSRCRERHGFLCGFVGAS